MEKHLVAVCQIDCGSESGPQDNAEKICAYIKEEATKGMRLILFPELSLSGYSVDKQEVLQRCEATTEKIIKTVCACAKELEVATVVGVYEPAGEDKVYNVALAIGPDGSETRYQKIHIPPREDVFAPGQTGPAVADFGFVRLGMSICFDNVFGESARMAYLAGAEMLFMPFYWAANWEVCDEIERKRTAFDNDDILQSRRERMLKMFPIRAIDNGVYAVMLDSVNQSKDINRHLPGKSMVFSPYGELLAETKGWQEEVLHFEFDPERIREWRANDCFPGKSLRPEVYEKYLSRSMSCRK